MILGEWPSHRRGGRRTRERIVDTLLELMSIDSDNNADKAPIIEYASRRLRGLGMEVDVIGDADIPAVCAVSGRGGIVLSGHLDTVPVGEGWSRDQGEIEGDRIYGRGASDMKGAVAAVLEVGEALIEGELPFSVLLTTDEEEGMLGALELSGLDIVRESRGVVIGEPTGMMIVAREKGVCRFKITTRGRAGHSSQPWLGENAIMKMNGILNELRDLLAPPEGPTEDRTATLTTIRGGTKNNVIPESCSAEIDIRFPPQESIEGVKNLILDRLSGKDCGIEVTTELESFRTPESSPFVAEAARFLGTERFPAAFATEAARFGAENDNIVICGPGKPGTCHIVDEWVERDDLERFYDFLLHMAGYAGQG